MAIKKSESATSVKAIETITVDLEPKPGSLNAVLQAFREAGVDLRASWAFEMGPGMPGKGIFYAADTAKAEAALKALGKKPVRGRACWAEGEDKVGAYARLLAKVAAAGVNLHATDALGVGGRFCTVLFADEKDCDKLCKALGC